MYSIFWDVPPHSNRIIAILVAVLINFHFPLLTARSYIMIYVQPIPCKIITYEILAFSFPRIPINPNGEHPIRWVNSSFFWGTQVDAVGDGGPLRSSTTIGAFGVGDAREELLCILKLWKGNGKENLLASMRSYGYGLDGVHRVVQTVNALLIGFLNPSYPSFGTRL